MGQRFKLWKARSDAKPKNHRSLTELVQKNRDFTYIEKLDYGDHGLDSAFETILDAIKQGKKIALYADYDVDGTMSCVSWIWFLESIGYNNFISYIPDRFKEGYGVNLNAIKELVEVKKAEIIITMDTGITANKEAAWCKKNNIPFICTDHHKIQENKMPDCIILNPKSHPDPLYQEMCGCGITFVLLRKLGDVLLPPSHIWTDILALTGMATICDVVPLNGVNHKLAQHGVQALMRSQRPVLQKLLKSAAVLNSNMDERDIGFRLGPRINAVGRLDHADKIISAFVEGNPEPLIQYMGLCNEKRKLIQKQIVEEAREKAKKYPDDPILFLGGDWHPGVVGIAASKLSEEFWKPTFLYQKKDDLCKGSARSVPGFDVTDAMSSSEDHFGKFGGHSAAGGYSFSTKNEELIRESLNQYAQKIKIKSPETWESCIHYDCDIDLDLLDLDLTTHLDSLRPFGHCFTEPLFLLEANIENVQIFKDKKTGEPRHMAVHIKGLKSSYKIMFFNEVYPDLESSKKAKFLVTVAKNTWQGRTSLSLIGSDYSLN